MTTRYAHAAPFPLYLSVLMILVSRPALQDESANCGRTVVATPQGRIASPGYPLSYPPGSQCSYRIIPSDSRVCAALLRFEDLDLVCPGDALTVPSTGDRFCGVNPPESLVLPLPRQGLKMEFRSNERLAGTGFALRVTQLPDSCPDDGAAPCGGRFSEQEFRIEGPGARSGACLFLVTKSGDDICQLQMRYEEFSVGSPTGNGSCAVGGRQLLVAGRPRCGRKGKGDVESVDFLSRTLVLLYLGRNDVQNDRFVIDFYQQEC